MSKHKPSLMLGTTWRMAHLTVLCISNHQVAGFCDHHTIFFTFSVVFSNQGFQLQLYLGCWICEALVRLLLWKQSSRWISSSGGHLCCSTSMIYKHNPLQCTALIFGFLPLSLSWWCLPMICSCHLNLGNCHSVYNWSSDRFVMDTPAERAPTICPLWNSDSLPFYSISYKLLLNTICNVLILALHSTNIQKNNKRYN